MVDHLNKRVPVLVNKLEQTWVKVIEPPVISSNAKFGVISLTLKSNKGGDAVWPEIEVWVDTGNQLLEISHELPLGDPATRIWDGSTKGPYAALGKNDELILKYDYWFRTDPECCPSIHNEIQIKYEKGECKVINSTFWKNNKKISTAALLKLRKNPPKFEDDKHINYGSGRWVVVDEIPGVISAINLDSIMPVNDYIMIDLRQDLKSDMTSSVISISRNGKLYRRNNLMVINRKTGNVLSNIQTPGDWKSTATWPLISKILKVMQSN
jgi:hypothetical protein